MLPKKCDSFLKILTHCETVLRRLGTSRLRPNNSCRGNIWITDISTLMEVIAIRVSKAKWYLWGRSLMGLKLRLLW